jgi:hypothetical protein
MPPPTQPSNNLRSEFSVEKQNPWPLARDVLPAGGTFEAITASLCLSVGIYVFFTTLDMVIHGWSPVPYWDQWDELILGGKQVLSPWLYSQHNEHRILFPRLLFAIDTFAFAETNKFNFVCNVMLPLVLAGLIIYVAHRYISRRITDTLWIAGFVLTLLFSAMQFENFVWGFQVQFFGVELAAAASIGCLVLGRGNWVSLTASIGFSAIAVYTLASGMPVPFLAIPLAIWTKRSRAQVAVLAIAAVALLASYLYGYVSPAQHSSPLYSIFRPGLLHYAVAEIGNPFAQYLMALWRPHRLTTILDLAFGTLGLGLFARTGLVLLRRGRVTNGVQFFFFAIASFLVCVAFLTALGRLKFGAGQALSVRYASPMLLFWLSLAMLGFIEIQDRRPGLRPVAMGLSLLVVIGLASAQPAFVKSGLAYAAPRRQAMTALLANVEDADQLNPVYPHLQRLEELVAELRARHLAVFADAWSAWLGTPLSDHIGVGDPSQCRGDIDQVTRLPVPGQAQWRSSGWAWDKASGAPPDRVVLTDAAGRVVGYALGGYPPELGSGGPKHSGWRGHFAAENGASVTAYALVDRERAACPLAGLSEAR